MDNCVGCFQIKNEKFPFFKLDTSNYIDMENCGETENGEYISDLAINFCPVCGEKINTEKNYAGL